MSEAEKKAEVESTSKATSEGVEKPKEDAEKGVPHEKEEKVTEKKTAEEREEEEEKVVEEKSIKVNLRHAYLSYGRKAAPKAIKIVRKAASKAFRTEDVRLSPPVNEALWRRGKTKTERKITLRIQKLESGVARVLSAEG